MIKKIFSLKIYNLLIPLIFTFLLFILSYFLIFIPSFENSIIGKKKEIIKEITISAWNIMDFYNQKVESGEFSLEEAQELAKQQIENIRYGKENRDYLWINDYQPKMIMHPYKDELNNHDLSNYKDINNVFMFNKMVEIAKSEGEGYVEYMWQLKNDSTQILPKISYIKAYKPWDWIVGTGVYLSDIKREVSKMKTKLGVISLVIVLIVLILFIYILIREITKDRFLNEIETKYQKLFDFSNDAIFLMNSDGFVIVDCNPKTLELFNCEKKDIINKTIIEFSPEYQMNGKKSVDLAKKIVTLGIEGVSQFLEWTYYTFDKKERIAEVSLNRVDIKGQVFIMASARDITERKKDEQRLVEAVELAENADKLKSSFLANMSHEIRTPMNGILGFSQLIKNDKMPNKQRNEFIDIINSKGNQLLQIINDIIDISKIESNQIKLYYSDFSLNKMFDELYNSFRTETNEVVKSNIEFVVKKELPDEASFIKSDRTRIIQILNNLLSNAFKYSNEGIIELGYIVQNSVIEFYVKDKGIGVKDEDKHMIFDRFTQADGSMRRLYGGTGLGLSISKGLVKLLGGKIGVEPNNGKGSRFYFTIPHKFVSNILDTRVNEEIKKPDWSNKNILVVEDDIISFEFLKESLRSCKVNLKHAKTGEDALHEHKKNKYDLILMDIQLPEADGYEITRKIREIDKEIPIVAQTANAFAEDRDKSLAAGCNDYISKPIDRKLLIKIINHYI